MAVLSLSLLGQGSTNPSADSPPNKLSPLTVSVGQLKVPAKAVRHLEAAQRRFAKMQLTEAAIELQRAIQVYPEFGRAFFMDAMVKLAAKDYPGSVESAAHAISLDTADAYSWVALATAYNSLNEWPEAEAAAGRALALSPLAWQARLELAKSYYGQERFSASLRTLDQLRQDIPDIHLVRANSLMRLGRSQEAVKQFWIFLQEAPNDSRAQQIRQIVSRSPSVLN